MLTTPALKALFILLCLACDGSLWVQPALVSHGQRQGADSEGR